MKFVSIIALFCVLCAVSCEDAAPIQLLDFDLANNNGTVQITKGVIEKLFLAPDVADREVVVVSIAGALRKGKSFLLNYILRYLYANYRSTAFPNKTISANVTHDWLGDKDAPLTGFPWKSSTKRLTTGIIFWSDIFLYDAPNGDRIAIYLMDTQGLFDHESTPTENIRIFSLSALISSFQMMNIFSMIEESNLEYLQFATEVARFSAVDSTNDAKPFQKLMFVIRDWISPDEYEYGLKDGDRFIKRFLTVKNFHTPELKSVREYIQKTFESISCCLMPYPGKSVARNSSYNGRWADIDEEFIDIINEFFPSFLAPKNLNVKTINGVPVTALELSIHVQKYVELFKSTNMPEAKSIYESTLDNQFQILMSKAVEVYLQEIQANQSAINDFDQVSSLHNVSTILALRYFDSEKKFGSESDQLTYRRELQQKLEEAFVEWATVTLEHLNTINNEQKKTDEQVALTNVAKERDQEAKKEVERKTKEINEMKRKLEASAADTSEARRENEELRKLLEQREAERKVALDRELETRRYLNEMAQKAEFFRQQLELERARAANAVKQRVVVIQKRDGLSQFFHGLVYNISNTITYIVTKTVRSFQ